MQGWQQSSSRKRCLSMPSHHSQSHDRRMTLVQLVWKRHRTKVFVRSTKRAHIANTRENGALTQYCHPSCHRSCPHLLGRMDESSSHCHCNHHHPQRLHFHPNHRGPQYTQHSHHHRCQFSSLGTRRFDCSN